MSATESNESIRLRVRVTGRVQGVGFRYFTLRAAQGLGVTGWVRNEPDRSVACEAAGRPAAVDAFLERLRVGPKFARVDEVEIETLEPQPAPGEFRII